MVGVKRSETIRRESILSAAARVALSAGIEGVAVRPVAVEAALSTGLVYFYFQSKNELLHALLGRVIARALDGPQPGFGEELDPDEALYTMLSVELTELRDARDELDLLFQFYFLRNDDEFRRQINDGILAYRSTMSPVVERYAVAHALEIGGVRAVLAALVQGAAIEVVRTPDDYDPAAILDVVRTLPSTGRPRSRAAG